MVTQSKLNFFWAEKNIWGQFKILFFSFSVQSLSWMIHYWAALLIASPRPWWSEGSSALPKACGSWTAQAADKTQLLLWPKKVEIAVCFFFKLWNGGKAGAGVQLHPWAVYVPVIYVSSLQGSFLSLFIPLLRKREAHLQWVSLLRQCAANNHRVVTSVAAQGRLQPRCQDWPLTLFDTGRSCSSISLIPELAGLPKPCAGHSRTRTSSSPHFSRRSCGVFLMPGAPSLASLAVFLLWKGEIQGGNSNVEVSQKGLSSHKLCSVIAVGQV